MKFTVTILATLFWFSLAVLPTFAQDTLWSKIYGHTGSGGVFDSDRGMCGTVTSDGGYAFGGVSFAFVGMLSEYWLVRTDVNGDTLWTRHYGTTYLEEAHYVIQTSDGGFVMCGDSKLDGSGYYDMYIVKTDSLGDTLWTRNFGEYGKDDHGWAIIQTSDNGYLAVGQGSGSAPRWGDVYLVKLDSLGNEMWTKLYGGSYPDYAYGVVQVPSSGFAITGLYSYDGIGTSDLWLLRTNSSGDTIGTIKYNIDGRNSKGDDIVMTPDGGFVIAGHSMISYTNTQLLLLRTDSLGNTIWYKQYGGSVLEYARSVDMTLDGGFVAGGATGDYFGKDYYIVRTDSFGDSLWTAVFGNSGRIDYCHEVRVDPAGDIMAFGQRHQSAQDFDYWLLKIIDAAYIRPGNLTGIVKEEDDITPIAGVVVSIYDSGNDLARIDTTDLSGEFGFSLDPDTYYATFSKTDYNDTTLTDLEVVADETTMVNLIMYLSGYAYLPGDVNMALGIWPPQCIGGDVTYLVGYFIGGGQAACLLDGFWCSADINGDCVIIGGDVTALVGYFVAGGALVPCPEYESAWLEGIPDDPPDGWPNCETPVINSKVIPTGSVK